MTSVVLTQSIRGAVVCGPLGKHMTWCYDQKAGGATNESLRGPFSHPGGLGLQVGDGRVRSAGVHRFLRPLGGLPPPSEHWPLELTSVVSQTIIGADKAVFSESQEHYSRCRSLSRVTGEHLWKF